MLEQDEMFGLVVQVESANTCHIAVMAEGGWLWRESCVHRGDWAIRLRPARFEDNLSGVWELADSEIQQRENARRLGQLEEMVTMLQAKVCGRTAPAPDTPPETPEPKHRGASGRKGQGKSNEEKPEPVS